ncbi:SDR family NAD(P)-dependent oxidoreductase [Lentzea sp. NPDC058436]|uniref:SDR family NAD(P)-dependent oxidoreductase n=1 Tax=Lentzea sp. NPDC058436 TaxID=3346499 RepID=UPI003666494F
MTRGPLRDRTVVVTGASSGIGAQAARQLVTQGARVVVVGRDRARTEQVADALATSGRPVSRHVTDFADLSQVRRLAADLTAELGTIDVLLSNAGGAFSDFTSTVDGHEPNYQVNTLSPFLLLRELTPALAGGRVVATNSRSHRGAALHHEDVGGQLDRMTGLGPHQRYAVAKLASLFLHREHRRLHPEVEIVDVHPGLVASDFGRYLGRTGAVLKHVARPVLRSPAAAASTLVRLAATAQLPSSAYFVRDHRSEPSGLVNDRQLAAAVYADALRRLDLIGHER